MKFLMENWSSFLKEDIDPRIMKKAELLLKSYDDLVVLISEEHFKIKICYSIVQNGKIIKSVGHSGRYGSYPKEYPRGIVEISPAEEMEGPCFEGYAVRLSSATRGWGPLLYEIALELASNLGGGLMADRLDVSSAAEAVWDKYIKRPDVKNGQLDIGPLALGAPNDELKDFYYKLPKLTPKYEPDDCDQIVSVEKEKENWANNSASKIFYKDNKDLINFLKNHKRLIVK